jgi:hypothetical protein
MNRFILHPSKAEFALQFFSLRSRVRAIPVGRPTQHWAFPLSEWDQGGVTSVHLH